MIIHSLLLTKTRALPLIQKRGIAVNRERRLIKKTRAKFSKALRKFFKVQAPVLAADITALVMKSDISLVEAVIAAMTFKAWVDDLPGLANPYISAIAVDGGTETLAAMGVTSPSVMALMRVRAEAWASSRAAELVGRRIVDGQLVANTNAVWAITESTRSLLRDTVVNGLREGLSPQELASTIETSYAFSASRATMVARTEMAMADMAGSMESFRATPGIVGKKWLTAGDELVSDECQACEDAGVIPLDSSFPGGADAPPNHPNCRCAIEPVFDDEMET